MCTLKLIPKPNVPRKSFYYSSTCTCTYFHCTCTCTTDEDLWVETFCFQIKPYHEL